MLGSVTSYCEFCALAPDQLRHRRRQDRLVSGAQPGIEKVEDRELFGLKDAALPIARLLTDHCSLGRRMWGGGN